MTAAAGMSLEAGHAALAAGDWIAAEEAFRRAVEEGGGPAAALGLAEALYWRGDPESRTLLARAYSGWGARPAHEGGSPASSA